MLMGFMYRHVGMGMIEKENYSFMKLFMFIILVLIDRTDLKNDLTDFKNVSDS